MNKSRGERRDELESDDLAARLGAFGGRTVEVAEQLPDTKIGRHIRNQLFRAGTAPGAHYAEARSSQSPQDFIHKIGLAAKEARESLHWLRVIRHTSYLDRQISSVMTEADELIAILFSSLHTARQNQMADSPESDT